MSISMTETAGCVGALFIEADPETWSEADYRRLLDELSPIFLSQPGDPDFERSINLCGLIEEYERLTSGDDNFTFVPTTGGLAEYEATKNGSFELAAV